MPGSLVAITRTPASSLEMAESFRRGWVRPEPLTNKVLWLLLAHWDLETAAGTKMWNWNAGNIVRTSQWEGDWYKANDAGNAREFRSYPSRDAGAAALAGQLTSDTRPKWRQGLLSGDPTTFIHALAGRHGGPVYFEADPEKYLAGFLSRYNKYAGTEYVDDFFDPSVDTPTPVSTEPAPIWYAMAIAGLTAALTVWRARR